MQQCREGGVVVDSFFRIGELRQGTTVHWPRSSDLVSHSLLLSLTKLEGYSSRITVTSTKNVAEVLDRLLKDNIPWMRAQHGLKGFKFQTDNE